MRVVEYTLQGPGFPEQDAPYRLITTILDAEAAPATDLAALYHERWEIETALDELKTHQRGPAQVLRSRSPDGVEQEIWGHLLVHYAIRSLMHDTADAARLDTDRLSFTRSIRLARRQVTAQAAFRHRHPRPRPGRPGHRRQRPRLHLIAQIADRHPTITKAWAHNGYKKPSRRTASGIDLEIVQRDLTSRGFNVQLWRWVEEPTSAGSCTEAAWFETSPPHRSAALIDVAAISLMARRLIKPRDRDVGHLLPVQSTTRQPSRCSFRSPHTACPRDCEMCDLHP
ncbi:transposase [Streptomyces lunaelactis]|uniref:transposase n=1 Tax=Streptomyces lunaelactis TaxID=1535768 RepID=UPI0026D88A00